MLRAEVVVLPVALVPAPSDQLRMMVFAPGGEFLRARPASVEDVAVCGEALVTDAGAGTWAASTSRLEDVAFMLAGHRLRLIYTTALPVLAWDEHLTSSDEAPEGWEPLTPWVGRGRQRKPESLPPEQVLVRNYWRRQFEETSAALDFLPKYFTTSQVRAAYSSLWGEEQHVGAFHRWLHDREPPAKAELVVPVDEVVVRQDAERVFAHALEASELGPQIGTLGGTAASSAALAYLGGGSVGLSMGLVARGALGILPAALAAGGLAGSRVAYQRRVGRGKKPLWYTRAHKSRILIGDPYAPRPRWLAAGEEPGRFQ